MDARLRIIRVTLWFRLGEVRGAAAKVGRRRKGEETGPWVNHVEDTNVQQL
jgi:hypothetical protein